MLAIATTASITIVDQLTLKRTPASVTPVCTLNSPPTSLHWASDNNSLLGSTATQIHKYDTSGKSLNIIHSLGDDLKAEPIIALISKDRGSTVIFSRGQQVHVLEARSGRLVQTFDSHKAGITSIALSNDGTLLATTSAGAVHVHNLTHGSHTVLRGLPADRGEIKTCSFHMHSRTRLLVGTGSELLIYDTTRPSGPIKTISLRKDKGNIGDVISVSSSPFSKTLVALACSGGTVYLVDLDKEKGLCRTVALHVPLTSLAFSPEGATLYVGTENGKLLLQDLRSLDKPPKSIVVSENGDRVIAISVQKKIKPEATSAKTGAAASKPLAQQDVNKKAAPASQKQDIVGKGKAPATSPVAVRAFSGKGMSGKTTVASAESPRALRARTAVSGSPGAGKASGGGVAKRVFSPPKSTTLCSGPTAGAGLQDLNVSVCIENLLELPTSKAKENVYPSEHAADTISTVPTSGVGRVVSRTSSRTSLHKDDNNVKPSGRSSMSSASTASRTRSASGSSVATSSSAAAARRVKKSSAGPVVTSQAASSVPPVPVVPPVNKTARARQSLTPSPELPDMDLQDPVTPLPTRKGKSKEKLYNMEVLGLGTPEVDRWVQAGLVHEAGLNGNKPLGRHVGFAGEDAGDEHGGDHSDSEDHLGADDGGARSKLPGQEMAMQVSPRRTGADGPLHWAPVPSPLRNLANPQTGSPRSHAAADLLQSLLRDAMYDFRQETHSELVGLHLDMLRMGRGLKSELRLVVDEFREELAGLKEENKQLREENQRLRRGY